MLPDSMNVGVIAENIRALQNEIGSIPVGKIPKDYTADETDTGLKWTDGKNIYRNVITGTFPTITQATDVDLGRISGIKDLINTWLIVKRTNNEILDLSNYAVKLNSDVFSLGSVNTPYSQSTFHMVVFYTKETVTKTKKKTSKKEA